jgi:hypothetical protein
MLDHWTAGREDAEASLNHREWIKRRLPKHGIAVFDLGIDRVTYTGADGAQEIDDGRADVGQVIDISHAAKRLG